MSYISETVERVVWQPINAVFRFLQNKTRVEIWVRHDLNQRFEGVIVGFDEYMNLVLVDAVCKNIRTGARHKLGKTFLNGHNCILISPASKSGESC